MSRVFIIGVITLDSDAAYKLCHFIAAVDYITAAVTPLMWQIFQSSLTARGGGAHIDIIGIIMAVTNIVVTTNSAFINTRIIILYFTLMALLNTRHFRLRDKPIDKK